MSGLHPKNTSTRGAAFLKGGAGCLGCFLALGLIASVVGGTFYLDVGGAIFLFVLGGLIGLLVFSIYQRGLRAGQSRPPDQERPGGQGRG